ncbi:hypothetical protein, partial [Kingella kingae]|uniref:hypothetical protein n=1 Tax=Kingella kingae TaxID=504 RepID=UPI001E50375F
VQYTTTPTTAKLVVPSVKKPLPHFLLSMDILCPIKLLRIFALLPAYSKTGFVLVNAFNYSS